MATANKSKTPGAAPAPAAHKAKPPTVTIFAADYWQNGQVLYPAGEPVPSTKHTQKLLDEGVEGEIRDAAAEASQASAQTAG